MRNLFFLLLFCPAWVWAQPWRAADTASGRFFLLLFCPAWVWAQPWRAADTASGRVRLCFIGDVMQHEPQITGAWDEEAQDYDYMPCFRYISPYWQEADYVIGNLETTLSDKGFSGYPQFCAPWQLARDLRRAGVDILTTNNRRGYPDDE